jgi:hypothetical protein
MKQFMSQMNSSDREFYSKVGVVTGLRIASEKERLKIEDKLND